jgi:hypothetical protein
MYEIFTGASTYEELDSAEVERLYKEHEFPDVSEIACGEIIRHYWLCEAASAQQVLSALDDIINP